MRLPKRHPLTLRFASDALEAAFLDAYRAASLRQVRYALLLSAVLYGSYGVLDALHAPDQMATFWGIRAVVCLLGLLLLAASFAPGFQRVMQPVLSGLLVAGGLGLMAMLALDTSGRHFYNGPVLVILAAYMMFRLRFVYATVTGWLVVAAFAVVALFIKGTPAAQFAGSVFFFSTANIIGMFAAYMLEEYARQVFWQTQVIDEKRLENERLVRAQSRFFANVSHEFRTPLTLIIGPLDNLLDGTAEAPLPEGLRRSVMVMHRQAQRLLRLINQILDLAKLEAGGVTLDAEPTPLGPFVEGVVASFASHAEQQGLDLQVEAEAAPEVAVVDRDKLEQVLVNLLSNALKFTPPGGLVRVRLARAGDEATLEVRDSGPGIAPADLPHVFDRFASRARPRRAADPDAQSTGIGLALTRELVTLHGGTIAAESDEGFGSTFTVRLPLGTPAAADMRPLPAAAETARRLPAPEAASPSALSPADAAPEDDLPSDTDVVLVVDDHADLRGFIAACLGSAYHVLEAATGTEGLASARAAVPDLIITDIMMPEMDGFAFTRALHDDPVLDHIPVLILTAKASPESRIAGLDVGADAYMAKPFNARELQARVRNLLENRRRLRRRFSREVLIEPTPIEVQSADDAFVARARSVVEEHLADAHFDVDAFAEAMHMSRRQLQRKLRAVADQSPSAFVRLLRLGRARQLLDQGYGTVSEVAHAVGWSNLSYFSKCFKDTFGQSPSAYIAADEPAAG